MSLAIQFEYTNWKGNLFTYVVIPENIEFAASATAGRYDEPGHTGPLRQREEPQWLLHAQVIARGGCVRDMNQSRRRTFKLNSLHNLMGIDLTTFAPLDQAGLLSAMAQIGGAMVQRNQRAQSRR